eukprot:gene18245-21830_t
MKLSIQHTLSNDRPLSQSLSNISQSLTDFSQSVGSLPSGTDILTQLSTDSIKIPLCTCQQSKNYPFCDLTHKEFNSETNSDLSPVYLKHPGGKSALLRFAGRDGTENVQFHSDKMLTILNTNYFIGHLRKDQQKVEPSKCVIS